jgi:hypothetical protein
MNRKGLLRRRERRSHWETRALFFEALRRHPKYVEWRNSVLARDIATYPKIPKRVQVHHIIPLGDILKENNIKTILQALKCPAVWVLENGTTLTTGEHHVITWLGRKKAASPGLIKFLKKFIQENEHNYYPWVKENDNEPS